MEGFRHRFEHAKHEFREDLESIMFNRLEDPKCHPVLLIFALKAHWPDKYRDVALDTDDEAHSKLEQGAADLAEVLDDPVAKFHEPRVLKTVSSPRFLFLPELRPTF